MRRGFQWQRQDTPRQRHCTRRGGRTVEGSKRRGRGPARTLSPSRTPAARSPVISGMDATTGVALGHRASVTIAVGSTASSHRSIASITRAPDRSRPTAPRWAAKPGSSAATASFRRDAPPRNIAPGYSASFDVVIAGSTAVWAAAYPGPSRAVPPRGEIRAQPSLAARRR